MAQEIVTWCDWHLNTGDKFPGAPRTVVLDAGKPMVMDLCDGCDKELLQPLRDVVKEIGRPADSTSRPPLGAEPSKSKNKIPCPEEGCNYLARGRSSFRSHFPDVHHVSLPVWEARNGHSIEGEEIKFFCDFDCEAGFTTPQGKGAHMSFEHGYTGPDSLNGQEPLPAPESESKPAKKAAKKAPAKKAS